MKENPIYLKRGRNVETQIFSLSQHDILAAHFLCVCIYIYIYIFLSSNEEPLHLYIFHRWFQMAFLSTCRRTHGSGSTWFCLLTESHTQIQVMRKETRKIVAQIRAVHWNYHGSWVFVCVCAPILLVHGNFKYFILNEHRSAPCICRLRCWYIVCVLFFLNNEYYFGAHLFSFEVFDAHCNAYFMINNDLESVNEIYFIG